MNVALLKQAGVNYEAGLDRFLDDAELYEAVLSAFIGDRVLERAQAAFCAGDHDALLRVAHEAKGSSGNADLTAVYAEASSLVALLRGSCTEDALSESFRRFEAAYLKTRGGIKAALEG